jgi:tripartite-type tricarboxylate transporter receptor subunit TctC
MRRRLLLRLAPLGCLPGLARAATWQPERTITMVTGYGPGGSTDIAARLLADRMALALGRDARIVVENRPGAAGTVATEWLKRQPADGHTIMVTETGAAVAAPAAIIGGTRYDPVADFTALGVISTPPGVLVVTPGFGGNTARGVLAALREAPPDRLTYASSGFGGVLHLRSELLAQTLGTHFVHVPYRSGAQMVQAIMTGEAQFGIAALASATPLMREGKVVGVAMIGRRRFPLFPDIPTLEELGVPGFENSGFFLLIGPAGMPRPAAEALNHALVAALHDPEVRDRMLFAGHDPVQGPNGLAEARAFLLREWAEMQGLVERTGIRIQP